MRYGSVLCLATLVVVGAAPVELRRSQEKSAGYLDQAPPEQGLGPVRDMMELIEFRVR